MCRGTNVVCGCKGGSVAGGCCVPSIADVDVLPAAIDDVLCRKNDSERLQAPEPHLPGKTSHNGIPEQTPEAGKSFLAI